MHTAQKQFWINISLLNLCLLAFFGMGLRSKILFALPFIDYSHLLNAHSHVAFTGWAGLSLITLLIYELLPAPLAAKRFYRWMLTGTEISTLGMAVTFPLWGYTAPAIIFSSLYIVVSFALLPVFCTDLLKQPVPKAVRLLSMASLASLVASAIGPFLLVYILVTKSANALLYRDAVYTFLHFQYNGFFTLAVFALLLNHVVKKGIALDHRAWRFALCLVLSVVPSLALSMLWQNQVILYVAAGIGCVLQLASLAYFGSWLRSVKASVVFPERLARTLWQLAAFSFGLKMLLNVGTIFPPLGHAVYGDRPVIIGFLHLVFLGFVTFFILALLVQHGYFKKLGKTVSYPFFVFGAGIIANEVLLMVQGLGNLFKITTSVFNELLWGGSILLFSGAVLLTITRFRIKRTQPVE